MERVARGRRRSTRPPRRKARSSSGARIAREVDWIPAAFGKLFPGIEVQFLGDNDIAVKVIAEARAGRHQVDVYWHSMTGILPVVQRDLLAPIDWSLFGIDKRNTAFDGRMGFTSNIVYAIAYNTKLAKESDVPTNWARHCSTRASRARRRRARSCCRAWSARSASPGARTRRCISPATLRDKTDILLTRAPRESLLQSGERIFAFGEIDSQVRALTAEGLPVGYVVPEPVVMGQFGASVHGKGAASERRAAAGRLSRFGRGQERELRRPSSPTTARPPTTNWPRKCIPASCRSCSTRPDNMVAREALFGKAAAILTGQAR